MVRRWSPLKRQCSVLSHEKVSELLESFLEKKHESYKNNAVLRNGRSRKKHSVQNSRKRRKKNK